MSKLVCRSCGTTKDDASFQPTAEDRACDCGGTMVTPWSLKPRKPLAPAPPKKDKGKRKPMKRGRGFAVHPKQREKIAGLPCAFCGREASDYVEIDPAHLWPRGKGGCDHIDCVIPACRAQDYSCHRLLDEGKLDGISALMENGYWTELGHAISAHHLSPLTLLERVTGQEWQPLPHLNAETKVAV